MEVHTAMIGAQLWQGPAIISSVKTDLIAPTLDARAAQGEVRVYDPSRLTTMPSASWSPLRDARSTETAQRSAARLLSAVHVDQSSHGTFWSRHGEALLGGLLWIAANTDGLTMTDVARWVLAMDQPTTEDPGKAASYLRALASSEGIDPQQIEDVTAILAGIFRAEGRVSSSYYTSARHAVMPWTREDVRRISDTTTIDLDWLTSGNNTLYVAAPLMDQELLAHRRPSHPPPRTNRPDARHRTTAPVGRDSKHPPVPTTALGIDRRRLRNPTGDGMAIQSPNRRRIRHVG